MNLKILFSFLFCSIIPLPTIFGQFFGSNRANYLEHGHVIKFSQDPNRSKFAPASFQIYCYKGSEKNLQYYFQTIYLQLDIDNDDFTQYEGYSPEIVKEHYEEQRSLFSFNFFNYKKTRLKLNPFNQTCIGIETHQNYNIRLNLIRIDLLKLSLLFAGLIIFFFAATLSKNSVFYYLSGIGLGVSASFLIFIYFTGKIFPRKTVMYGVLIGGWTIAYYLINLIWDNIQVILVTYRTYVLWYILITGFISFIICYRLGPPKNQRSKDLVKWSLQAASLLLIYFSSQIEEFVYAVIAVMIFLYYCPITWFSKFKKSYRKWFPQKRRFLTKEEFEAEGIIETKKALTELRDYCSSPECKSWRVMTKLKDPKRFASFMEGENHVWEDEVFDYENSKNDLTESSEDDKSENEDEHLSEDEEENAESDEIEYTTNQCRRERSTSLFDRNKISSTNRRSLEKRNTEISKRSLNDRISNNDHYNNKIINSRYQTNIGWKQGQNMQRSPNIGWKYDTNRYSTNNRQRSQNTYQYSDED